MASLDIPDCLLIWTTAFEAVTFIKPPALPGVSDYAEARSCAEKALTLSRQAGEIAGEARSLLMLGVIATSTGPMWAESAGVGKGSMFHCVIEGQAAPEVIARPHLRSEQPDLAGRRLLIVDDNATNRRILVMQARGWGMVPRDTGSPHEALRWLRDGDPFDVAILDMHIPEMTGVELAAAIHEIVETGTRATPTPLI